MLKDADFERLKLYKTPDLLISFFKEQFTSENFYYVWYFMRGYVGYDGSTELGKYYIKCKTSTASVNGCHCTNISSNLRQSGC